MLMYALHLEEAKRKERKDGQDVKTHQLYGLEFGPFHHRNQGYPDAQVHQWALIMKSKRPNLISQNVFTCMNYRVHHGIDHESNL